MTSDDYENSSLESADGRRRLGSMRLKPEPDAVRPGFVAAKTSRLEYVDAVRVILILLVVAHHSVEAHVVQHPTEMPLLDPPIPRAWVFLWVNAAFSLPCRLFHARGLRS